MENDSAISALGALAQGTRLDAFRLLVRHEPDGLAAGDIARQLDVPQNTMSAHLGILARAGLVRSERHSRSIIYRADLDGLRALDAVPRQGLLRRQCGAVRPAHRRTHPLLLKGSPVAVDIVIYHNPECGTSRNTLGLIRNAGIEPHVVEYLKTPPSRALLVELIDRAGMTPRELLREKGTPYAELGLDDTALSGDALVDAMMAHPILINRPLVVSPLGVKLCRPSEAVLDLLPGDQRGAFAKEDGQQVVDASGQRVA